MKKFPQPNWSYFSIIFLAIALYIGFDDILVSEQAGVSRETINAAIGAIFVIVTTMYMFTGQTKINIKMLRQQKEIEQEKELQVEISKSRLKLYESSLNTWRKICYTDEVDKEQLGECLHAHLHLAMIGSRELFECSNEIMKKINIVYSDPNTIKMDQKKQIELFKKLAEFVKHARSDLQAGDELPTEIIKSFIENTKKATEINTSRNYDKFSFNGEIHNKRKLVLSLVRYVVEKNKTKTLEDLKIIFKDTLWSEGKLSKNKIPHIVASVNTAKQVDGLKDRHFWKDDEIIELGNGDLIVVNNQWGNNIDYFIKHLPANLRTKIKRH